MPEARDEVFDLVGLEAGKSSAGLLDGMVTAANAMAGNLAFWYRAGW